MYIESCNHDHEARTLRGQWAAGGAQYEYTACRICYRSRVAVSERLNTLLLPGQGRTAFPMVVLRETPSPPSEELVA